MTIQTSDNKFGPARWIVDPTAGLGTHTTITSALNAASAGETIFIREGTYTEDLTLKAGVNLVAWPGNEATEIVKIIGKCSASFEGSASLSSLALQTNGDFCLEVTGANDTDVLLFKCNILCTNNTGINFTSSNADSLIDCIECFGNITTLGNAIFSSTSVGTLDFEECDFGNDINSTTSNTASSGNLFINWTQFINPIETTGTVNFGCNWSSLFIRSNTTALTLSSSGGQQINFCTITSGTASDIEVTTSAEVYSCILRSTNANVITGGGTCNIGGVVQSILSTGILNPTTLTGVATNSGSISFDGGNNKLDFYETGTWTPTLTFGGGSTGIVYTFQQGRYTRIGNIVHYHIFLQISNKGTSTGNAVVSGFPFTVFTGESYANPLGGWARLTPPATFTGIGIRNLGATTTADIITSSNAGGAFINMDNTMFANSSLITTEGFYYV